MLEHPAQLEILPWGSSTSTSTVLSERTAMDTGLMDDPIESFLPTNYQIQGYSNTELFSPLIGLYLRTPTVVVA